MSKRRNKTGHGIRNQIRKPLMIFVFFLLLITALFSIFLVTVVSYRESMMRASDQAHSAADELSEYKALTSLTGYWQEHRDDLEKAYDAWQLHDMESTFRDLYPDTVLLTEITDEEFAAMPEENRRLYAEICYGRACREFDEIKRSFNPQYLFSCIVSDPDIYIIITGTLKDEARISQGGEVFELGVTVPYERGYWPELDAFLEDSVYANSDFRVDYDRDRKAAVSWQPVYAQDSIVMFVGASVTITDMIRQSLPTVGYLLGLIAVAFVYLEIWIMILLRKNVVVPVEDEKKIILGYMEDKDAKKAADGLKHVSSDNEIEDLARSFGSMIEELERYINDIRTMTSERERMSAELNVARLIQSNMLPRIFPPFPDRTEFELYASMEPAKEVGGDFYDFFLIDDEHLALVIGDVSGKSIPAALFMAISKTTIKNNAISGKSPAEILDLTNKALCDGNEENMFVTIWIGIVNTTTGEVLSSNGGHEHPVIRRAGGMYEEDIYPHDIVLGIMDEIEPYSERRFKLDPGDSLFVYTDGVPDAADPDEVFFGEERMLETLNRTPDAPPDEVIAGMRRSISDFVSVAERFDDITMICFKYLGGNPGRI